MAGASVVEGRQREGMGEMIMGAKAEGKAQYEKTNWKGGENTRRSVRRRDSFLIPLGGSILRSFETGESR